MIYVSSSCVRTKSLKEAIETLALNGITSIELSGGTSYDKNLTKKLIQLKDKYSLALMAHNYFPPPKEDFVLNLASLNDDIFDKSMEHYKRAIDLSEKVGATTFGMHAGFYINIATDQLGKRIKKSELFNKINAKERFCKAFEELKSFARGIDLYIENNVFSSANYQEYPNSNPFMLTSYEEYIELKQVLDFNLLLDVAHLKVSSSTLGLNFEEELLNMSKESDYWHLSDNNTLADENRGFGEKLLNNLQKLPTRPKKVTIEVYEDIETVVNSYTKIQKVLF